MTGVERIQQAAVELKSQTLGLLLGFGVEQKANTFAHNSTLADNEPAWGDVDKTKLPRKAFADMGVMKEKTSWKYPHHWVKNGGDPDPDNGVYRSGTMYLSKGGLNAAWAAANGARAGVEASPEVKAHLNKHRKDLGME